MIPIQIFKIKIKQSYLQKFNLFYVFTIHASIILHWFIDLYLAIYLYDTYIISSVNILNE